MNGMPTTDKDPIILSPGEIAVYKRNLRFNECKKDKVDLFSNRFICEFVQIMRYVKELIKTDGRVGLHPRTIKGIGNSNILDIPSLPEDFNDVYHLSDDVRKYFEKYRIGYDFWKNTYSFENAREMILECAKFLIEKKESDLKENKLDYRYENE
jgi:hypothetical protein